MTAGDSSEVEEIRQQLERLAEEGRRLTRIAETLAYRLLPPERKRGRHLKLLKLILIGAGSAAWLRWLLLRPVRMMTAAMAAGAVTAGAVTIVTAPLIVRTPSRPAPRLATPPAAATPQAARRRPRLDADAAQDRIAQYAVPVPPPAGTTQPQPSVSPLPAPSLPTPLPTPSPSVSASQQTPCVPVINVCPPYRLRL